MSRLLESLVETIDQLQALDVRTQGRRVGAIMASSKPADVLLAEVLVSVRMGLKTDWTSDEAAGLEAELQAEEKRLDRWLVTWSVGLERVS